MNAALFLGSHIGSLCVVAYFATVAPPMPFDWSGVLAQACCFLFAAAAPSVYAAWSTGVKAEVPHILFRSFRAAVAGIGWWIIAHRGFPTLVFIAAVFPAAVMCFNTYRVLKLSKKTPHTGPLA